MKFKTFFSFSMLDKEKNPYLNTSAAIEYHGNPKSNVKTNVLVQKLLNRAAISGDCETIKFLQNNEAEKIEGLKIHESLIFSIEKGHEESSVALIEWIGNGLSLQMDPESKDTLLHFAALKGQAKTCAALLKNNPDFDIDMKNRNKSTALHCAVASGNLETVRILLDSGASIKIKNNHKNTPISLAKLHNQQQILSLLENFDNHDKIDKTLISDPLAPSSSERISRIE
jgi:hypothetical protein